MDDTLAETLRPVAPYLPESLISPDWLGRIGAIARCLPAGMTSFFGFECPLGVSRPMADLLVCIQVGGGERECLAGSTAANGLPHTLATQPVWQRLGDFAAQWARPGSPIYERIDNVWLEFDVDQASPVTTPSVFFGPARSVRAPSAAPRARLSGSSSRADRWLVEAAIEPLRGHRLSAAAEGQLSACLRALPARAEAFQIGVMLGRGSDAVRLCLAGIARQAIPQYLRRVGWEGTIDEVSELVSMLLVRPGRVSLHLDVGESVGPRIGLEYYASPGPSGDRRWRPVLDELVRAGLCLPRKREGLLAYPGYTHELLDRARWPPRLLRGSNLLGGRALSVIARRLHHIKLTYQPGQPIRAKAYLAVGQELVPRAGG